MKKSTLAASAAVLLASGAALYGVYPALAQVGSGPMGHDPMGDATVTWAQAKERADMLWTRLDVNKDGMLNAADREAKMMQMFDQMDTNHDGSVSRAEFTEHHKAMMEGKRRDGAGPGMDGPPPMDMMMGHGGRMLHEMAEKADSNHDQSISRAEFDAAAKARFDNADTNHDGRLTAAERRAAWASMHEGHGWRGGHGHGMGHGMGPGMMGGDMGDTPPPPPPPGP